MAYNTILLEKEEGIGILYINRAKALNALNTEVITELGQAITAIAKDDDIKVLIITGSGDKAFVAGADIKEMENYNSLQGRQFAMLGQEVFRQVEKLEKPVIAAINGFALGGGCELAMSADIRFASENAVFGQPEVGLGITPGFGGTQRLPRLIGEAQAMELILGGQIIKADEAYRVGLINRIYPADQLMAETKKFAKTIMKNAPVAVSFSKSAIKKGLQVDIDTAMAIEADLFSICFATEDQKNGMKAFSNKEKIVYQGK